METQTHLCLYGGPVLSAPGGRTSFSPIQACLLALAYVEPEGTLTRERISWLLWDEGDGDRQRHRIRQLVYQINERAGLPVVQRDGDTVVPLIPSDTREEMPSDLAPLARITSPPTASFDHWLDGAIKTMEQARTERLAEIADALVRAGEWEGVFKVARRLCLRSDHGESWIGLLVRAAVRSSRPQAGRAVLLSLRQRSGIDGDEFLAHFDTLDEASRIRLQPAIQTPFLGRETELDWVKHQLEASSGLRFVVVSGEAGVGKTRLLEEIGLLAAAGGLHVSLARLSKTRANTPVAGLREILGLVVPRPVWEGLQDPWRSTIADLLGAHGAGLEVLDPLSNLHRLSQAARMALSSATLKRPSVVLIDDFQHIDPTSRDVLLALSSGWRGGPVAIVATVRGGASLRPLGEGLPDDAGVQRLHLQGLSPAACGRLLDATGTGGLSSEDVRELIALTAGNPLLLLDLARSRAATGREGPAQVPKSIRELTRLRLAGVKGLDLEVLALVTARPRVDSAELAGVLKQPSWRVTEGLDRLVSLGLVEPSEGGYDFRHALFREGIAHELGSTRMREAHLGLARFLAEARPAQPEQLVHHFREGGAVEEAGSWAVMAAERARDAGALREARRFYGMALAAPSKANEGALLGAAGQICLHLCDHEQGIRLLGRAEESCSDSRALQWAISRLDAMSESGRRPHLPVADELEVLAGRAREAGEWGLHFLAVEAAIRVLERAGEWRRIADILREVRTGEEPVSIEGQVRLRMVRALGVVYGDVSGSLTAAREAFQLSRSGAPESLLTARAAHRLFVVLLSVGQVGTEVGEACLRALDDRALRTGDLRLRYTSLANQAVWHLDTGELDTAQDKLTQAESVVRGTTAQNELQNLATNWGDLMIRQNRPAQALTYFQRASDLIQRGTRAFLRDLVRAGIGLSKLHLGQLREAEEEGGQIRSHDHFYFDPSLIFRLRTELLWRKGRRAEAVELLSVQRRQIRDHFVPQYLTLTLWEAQLRKRRQEPIGRQLLEEVGSTASALKINQLSKRARVLERHWND